VLAHRIAWVVAIAKQFRQNLNVSLAMQHTPVSRARCSTAACTLGYATTWSSKSTLLLRTCIRYLRHAQHTMQKNQQFSNFFHCLFLQVFDEELGAAAMGCVVRKAMRRTTKEFFAVKTFNMATVTDPKVQKKVSELLHLYNSTVVTSRHLSLQSASICMLQCQLPAGTRSLTLCDCLHMCDNR
jgi:hypothetical protein